MLILGGGGRGIPLDHHGMERWTRVAMSGGCDHARANGDRSCGEAPARRIASPGFPGLSHVARDLSRCTGVVSLLQG
jgi:hypothetical protein